MNKYKKVIERIKKKSFPILKNHKIITLENKNLWGVRVIYLYFFTLYIIGKGAEKGLSVGGVAHELSHIEMFKKWGLLKTILFTSLQYFSDNYRKRIERGADLLAIEKGYGKELHISRKNFLLKTTKEVKETIKKYYLSLNEIKRYTKKLK